MLFVISYHRRGFCTGIDSRGCLHSVCCRALQPEYWTKSAAGSVTQARAVCLRTQAPLLLYKHTGPCPAEAFDAHFDAFHALACEHDVPPASWWQQRPQRKPQPCAAQDRYGDPQVTVLSVDIEVLPCRDGSFPRSELDECAVVVIAATVARDVLSAESEAAAWYTRVWSLRPCAALGSTATCTPACELDVCDAFDTEAQMLQDFGRWFSRVNAGFITGWNVGFDLKYMLERCPALLQAFSAVPGARCRVDSADKVHVPGRVVCDMLHCVRVLLRIKSRSFKLGAIAAHVLGGTTKDPVAYADIRPMFDRDKDARAVLCTYCAKDSWLPLAIARRRQAWHMVFALARHARLLPQDLLYRGQSARVLSVMQVACYHNKPVRYAIPLMPSRRSGPRPTYRGALVLDATVGLHDLPVTCLDFSSLYPSIIRAYNVCVSTRRVRAHADDVARALALGHGLPLHVARHAAAYLSRADLAELAAVFMPCPARWQQVGEDGDFFVKPSHRKGVLPQVLTRLYEQRKHIKRQMKAVDGKALEYTNLDANQKAVKELMNSFYGSLALEGMPVAAWQAARAITGRGRQLLAATQRLAPLHCQYPSEVVYGDTDSVMVKMRCTSAQAKAEGERLAAYLTREVFSAPVELEYEKTWESYLIYKKKAYAGMLSGGGSLEDRFYASGMELVRTDTAPIVNDCQRACVLHALHGRVAQAIDHLECTLRGVRGDAPDKIESNLKPFTRCAALTKAPHEYADPKPAHVEVAMRLAGASKGDRIAYVVQRSAQSRVAERCLHPSEFDKAKHSVDRKYYAAQIDAAVTPWLRAAANANAALLSRLEEARKVEVGTDFMYAHAPLARMWGLQGTQRKRVAPMASAPPPPPKKRQTALMSVFKVKADERARRPDF